MKETERQKLIRFRKTTIREMIKKLKEDIEWCEKHKCDAISRVYMDSLVEEVLLLNKKFLEVE